MNDQEKDELLIRLDERTKNMNEKIDKFDHVIETVSNLKNDIKFIKKAGSTIAALGSLAIGLLEYFKK